MRKWMDGVCRGLAAPARAWMTSASADSVTVTWKEVQGARAYLLQIQGDLNQWQRKYWGFGTQHRLRHLACNTCYNLRVRAEADPISGDWRNFKAATTEGPTPSSALFCAISADRPEKVKKIILARPVLLEALYLNGQRPLTRAVALGRHRILQTLLQLGADLNAGDPATSRTALMYACQLGNSSCAKTLSDAGAQWHLQDRVGLSALQHALEGGEEVTRLALQAGSDVNLSDYSSWTPLMRIVILDSGTRLASLLLSEGALADKKDSLGMTALMHACLNEHGLRYVRLLLEEGNSNPYHKNNNGNNALDLARGRGDLEIIALLLKYLKEIKE